jgi:DNA-binding transcriptional LysR family regulator
MPSYRLDPFDLRLFNEVVNTGSITLAAKGVHLSVAAASERLNALEHELGVTLLQRGKTGTRPTDAGIALQRYSHRVLGELNTLYEEMAPFARGVRGTVRIAANTAAVSEFLPGVLARFLAKHEDIDVELKELWSHEILELVRTQAADLGIVADSVDTSGLDCTVFRHDKLVLITPRSGPLAVGKKARFADVASLPHVGLNAESALSRFLQDKASRVGMAMHHRVRVKSFDAVVKLVAAGVGVAIVPQHSATRLRARDVRVCELLDDWCTRRLLLCTRKGAKTSRHVQALMADLAGSSAVEAGAPPSRRAT